MSELESGPDLLNDLAHEFAERFRRGERPALTEYTERHPELGEQIREIFPALVMMEEFGSVAGQPPGEAVLPGAAAPRQLGEYRILREIGRGGMGVVYEAVQESLGRHVALKVLALHQLAGQSQRERFDREARAAARLHHTNIVPVFGTGESEGVHYYAMQFIQGQALDVVLEEVKQMRRGDERPPSSPLTASIAGSLLTDPARAVARDATPGWGVTATHNAAAATDASSARPASAPGNHTSELTGPAEAEYFRAAARVGVQVADALAYAHRQGIVHRDIKPSNLLLDTQGVAWITDFGLVKDESSTNLTNPGDVLGTIRYMAPERFQEQSDGRSDVYSLGTTLFEMLALRPAFEESQRAQLIDRVRHEAPAPLRKLDPRIPRDLETVVLKAMAKEPGRRYQTADELADDLRRYLADRPVLARRSTTAERAWRWCRRNPVVAGLVASVVVLLVVLLGGALVSNVRLKEQLERAERAEREKTEKLWNSYLTSAQASRWSGRVGRRFDGLEAVRSAAAIRPDLRLRNEAIALFALPDMRIVQELPQAYPAGTRALALDAGFDHYARSDNHGNVSVRRAADDREIASLPGFGPHAYYMKFSPDRRFLAAFYDKCGDLHVWDVDRCQVILKTRVLGGMDFSPDSRLVAVHQGDGKIHLHDLVTGKEVRQLSAVPVAHCYLAFHPAGHALAVTIPQIASTRIYDVETGKVMQTLAQPASRPLWQSDGSSLALMGSDHTSFWNTRTWTRQAVVPTGGISMAEFALNHQGDLLASTGWDEVLRLWDPINGRQLLSRHGSGGGRGALQFSREGRLLAGTREDAKLQIWEVTAHREYHVLPYFREPKHSTLGGIDISPDGRLLACAGGDGVDLWDLGARRKVATLPTGETGAIIFSTDGASVITSGGTGVQRWPIESAAGSRAGALRIGPPQLLLSLPHSVRNTICRCPGGKVAATTRNGHIIVLDPKDPSEKVVLPEHHNVAFRIEASPDGRWLAGMTHMEMPQDMLRVSDVRTRKIAWTHPVKTQGVFSPDGNWLVTGGDECCFWKVGAWQRDRVIPREAGLGETVDMAFSPDGTILAIAYAAQVVRLVDPQSGRELATLTAPNAPSVKKLCFSADGSQLASLTDLEVQLWDLRLIRQQLADMGLEGDLPAYPPAALPAEAQPITIRVLP